MKRCLMAIAAALLATAARANAVGARLAFTHVNVVDVESGRILRDRTVTIDGARIASVGPSRRASVGSAFQTIDARGKYLIPGLWDMHAHNFNYISGRPPRIWQFPLFVANGVTGVRDMWVKPKDMPLIRKWRQAANRGDFIGPRFGAVGTIVDGPWDAQPGHFPGPNVNVAVTPEEGRAMVRELQSSGVDFLKTYNSLDRDVYLAILNEAKHRHFPVEGHVPWSVEASLASDSGQRSIEHLTGVLEGCSSAEPKLLQAYRTHQKETLENDRLLVDTFDAQRCAKLARTFARNGTALVPTLVLKRTYAGTEPLSFFTEDARQSAIPGDELSSWSDFRETLRTGLARGTSPPEWDEVGARWWKSVLAVTALMERNGVMILAGTDVGNPYLYPGSSLIDELALLHQAGLTTLEALQAATLNPARFLGIDRHFGTVEGGKTADLVLLDANPLDKIENVRRIDSVVLNGRYFDRKALDLMLAKASASAKPSPPAVAN